MGKSSRGTGLYRRLLIVAAVFILYAALLPFNFVTNRADVEAHIAAARQRSAPAELPHVSRSDVLQNVLLFVPFGALAAGAQRRRRTAVVLAVTVVLAAVLSTTCELLQLLTIRRITSIWDVGANLTGAFVGAVAWIAAGKLGSRVDGELALQSLLERHTWPLTCAVALVCIGAWEPFDVTLDVGTVWAKVKPFTQGHWWSSQPVSDDLLTALRFAILTVAASEFIRERRGGARLMISAPFLCVLLAMGLEGSQFLITSRSPSLQDLAAMISGAIAGAVTVPVLRFFGHRTTAIVAATIVAAIPYYLAPFTLASSYRAFALMPFRSYYEFTSLQTVSHVVELMLIFAPIGFAIAWSADDRRRALALLVVGVIATGLESAQGWASGRFPDVTDIGMALLGGLSGIWLATRPERRRAARDSSTTHVTALLHPDDPRTEIRVEEARPERRGDGVSHTIRRSR